MDWLCRRYVPPRDCDDEARESDKGVLFGAASDVPVAPEARAAVSEGAGKPGSKRLTSARAEYEYKRIEKRQCHFAGI